MMPNALDAFKALITEVKATFGDHGELSNPAHPLATPMAEAEARIQELEALTVERAPTVLPDTKLLNPTDVKLIFEQPVVDSPYDVHFKFTTEGLLIDVIDPEGALNEEVVASHGWMWDEWMEKFGPEVGEHNRRNRRTVSG